MYSTTCADAGAPGSEDVVAWRNIHLESSTLTGLTPSVHSSCTQAFSKRGRAADDTTCGGLDMHRGGSELCHIDQMLAFGEFSDLPRHDRTDK